MEVSVEHQAQEPLSITSHMWDNQKAKMLENNLQNLPTPNFLLDVKLNIEFTKTAPTLDFTDFTIQFPENTNEDTNEKPIISSRPIFFAEMEWTIKAEVNMFMEKVHLYLEASESNFANPTPVTLLISMDSLSYTNRDLFYPTPNNKKFHLNNYYELPACLKFSICRLKEYKTLNLEIVSREAIVEDIKANCNKHQLGDKRQEELITMFSKQLKDYKKAERTISTALTKDNYEYRKCKAERLAIKKAIDYQGKTIFLFNDAFFHGSSTNKRIKSVFGFGTVVGVDYNYSTRRRSVGWVQFDHIEGLVPINYSTLQYILYDLPCLECHDYKAYKEEIQLLGYGDSATDYLTEANPKEDPRNELLSQEQEKKFELLNAKFPNDNY